MQGPDDFWTRDQYMGETVGLDGRPSYHFQQENPTDWFYGAGRHYGNPDPHTRMTNTVPLLPPGQYPGPQQPPGAPMNITPELPPGPPMNIVPPGAQQQQLTPQQQMQSNLQQQQLQQQQQQMAMGLAQQQPQRPNPAANFIQQPPPKPAAPGLLDYLRAERQQRQPRAAGLLGPLY